MFKRKSFAAIAILSAALSLSSCSDKSNDDEMIISDECAGYFQTVMGTPYFDSYSYEAGVAEIQLTGSTNEEVIPITYITDDRDKYVKASNQFATYNDGSVIKASDVYTQAGYDSYPNSLDFTYHCLWADFSTYKETTSTHGVLRIAYEENPYNVERTLWLILKNQQSSEAYITQEANPNGVSPSAN